MDEEILRKLDELVKMGKLSEEEKEEILREILNDENDKSYPKAFNGNYKRIFITAEIQDLEIEGSDIADVQIEEGIETVNIEDKDDELKIVSKLKLKPMPGFNFSRLVSTVSVLRIRVPRETNINIHTISGDVKIKGIKGKISIKSLSGDTIIEEVEGYIEFISTSGDLNLTKVKGRTDFHLKSGDVKIKESQLEGNLKTYSGDVFIERSSIKGLEFNIFSGDIKIVDTSIEGDINGKSKHGDMEISMRSDNLLIFLETKRGDVEVFKNGIRENVSNREAIIGEGRNKVKLISLSGDIKVSINTNG